MKPVFRSRIRIPALMLLVITSLTYADMQPVSAKESLSVTREKCGEIPDGTPVELYTLTNSNGYEARVMTLGATLTTFQAPDRDGLVEIITLGKNSLDEYVKSHSCAGSIVGRYANRIANARFTIDGTEYPLVANYGEHQLHGGGQLGFHCKVWQAESIDGEGYVGVRLSLDSPDGEAGFPGNLHAEVEYRLTRDNKLVMDYTATTDRATHLNLTNHAYWNLDGVDDENGSVMDHVVRIDADAYVPFEGKYLIPTGEIRSVDRTPFDFRKPHRVGERIDQIDIGKYDHCYVLPQKTEADGTALLRRCAKVVSPASGRVMEVFTTQPGVQFYTGNSKALCLETQHYPNAPNEPSFPSTLLRPGETFRQTTVHQFRAE